MTVKEMLVRKTVNEPDGSKTDYDYIPIEVGTVFEEGFKGRLNLQTSKKSIEELGTLASLCRDLFVKNWNRIVFGPCTQGAVFEIMLTEAPKTTLWDGYLTVVIPPGPGHFHLCIGNTKGLPRNPTSKELSRKRECREIAFFHSVRDKGCVPESFGIRLWNGDGEQMISFFLPSPYLSDKQRILKKPDMKRLDLWNELRERYL